MNRPRAFQEQIETKSPLSMRKERRGWTSAWLERDRPDLEPLYTYPIDEKFQRQALSSHDCQRNKVCKFISNNIRHVSFVQFLTSLDKTVDQLIASGALDRPYALVSTDEGQKCKSGVWVMALILEHTRIGSDPRYYPTVVSEPGEDVKVFKHRAEEAGIDRLVMVDDAAYSGMQASEAILGLFSRQFKHIDVLIPFVTERALKRIALYSRIPSTTFWYSEIIPVGPGDLTALYFDHKMADRASTLPEVAHWISGCRSSFGECPVPPYKQTASCPEERRRQYRMSDVESVYGRRLQQQYLKNLPSLHRSERFSNWKL